MIDGYVSISREEYAQLVEDQQFLNCLEQLGVDNWEGYEHAISLWRELDETASDTEEFEQKHDEYFKECSDEIDIDLYNPMLKRFEKVV